VSDKVKMENLGYKEGSAKAPKVSNKRRMSRQRGSVVDNEVLPLSMTPRYDKEFLMASVVIT
jgi:hypothetical protein